MAHRSNVPKFGDWNEGDVPFTACFDNARKNRGGKMINPNDPQENPDMFPNMDPRPKPRARPEDPIGRGRENGNFRQSSNYENTGPRPVNESNHGAARGGQRPARSTRPSVGSDLSVDNSPLHPAKAAAPAGRGGRTPDRSRHKPTRFDESPERGGAAIPAYDWNDNNLESAENYTGIFEKVRDNKNGGTRNSSTTPNRAVNGGQRAQQWDVSKKPPPFWHRYVFFWRK
ncbi:hypothetical protein ACP275_04G228400 [Erythranthe tilingii]